MKYIFLFAFLLFKGIYTSAQTDSLIIRTAHFLETDTTMAVLFENGTVVKLNLWEGKVTKSVKLATDELQRKPPRARFNLHGHEVSTDEKFTTVFVRKAQFASCFTLDKKVNYKSDESFESDWKIDDKLQLAISGFYRTNVIFDILNKKLYEFKDTTYRYLFFSPKRDEVFGTTGNKAVLFNYKTKKIINTLRVPGRRIYKIEFNATGNRFAVRFFQNDTVNIYEFPSLRFIAETHYYEPDEIKFHGADSLIIFYDAHIAYYVDARTGKEITKFDPGLNIDYWFGKRDKGTWLLSNGDMRTQVFSPDSLKSVPASEYISSRFFDYVNSSPSGKYLCIGIGNNVINIFDTKTRQLLYTIEFSTVDNKSVIVITSAATGQTKRTSF